MRRVVLLALLAMALPTAALANTIDFGNGGIIGTNASTSGTPVAGGTWSVSSELTTIVNTNAGTTTTGNLGTVTVTTGTLVSCGTGCFTFTGGTIDIVGSGGGTLFMGSFNGTLISAAGVISLSYAEGGIPVIGGFQVSAAGLVSGDTIVTPEPGTLGLLGTGLLGLAGIVRRKIRG
jgi:PEP-CTERM motif